MESELRGREEPSGGWGQALAPGGPRELGWKEGHSGPVLPQASDAVVCGAGAEMCTPPPSGDP